MKNPAAVALGSIKSQHKSNTSRRNGSDTRSHIIKVEHFCKLYPYPLESNEWRVKVPIDIDDKHLTYNPDFYCKRTAHYIEVTTSKPNISEQRAKWIAAIRKGFALKVFWWEGGDITDQLMLSPSEIIEWGKACSSRINGKRGGRPKKVIKSILIK